ncbi:RNA-binding protein [uncultured Veillonella sp.]|uniref:YlmH family RNA-binding protein n=1 Tax=uncultured Veillonella sp. TaxID=159268 RepID=UPI0025F46102|nr:YlmH/Sll1252 family protein [uncultured Veillonella sp.]MDY3973655.1 YlmH/Sll1252 family protein [Veillonella caviae]
MKDREKLIRYFEASGNGEQARRMLDLAEQVVAGKPYRVTEFMSPAGLVIADAIKANLPQLRVASEGGYEGAERLRVAFIERNFQGTVDFGVQALKISWDPRFRLLTHRDVLGSLMGLGIEREHFGDIIMQNGGAQLIVDATMADYVKQNFTKIAMVSVSVEDLPLSEILPKEEKIKEIRTTVASLRLDAVASSGFSLSRTKLVSSINAGLVQVNWQEAKGPAQEVKEGDIISLRGRGRMKIEAITGTSRKGRIGVYLKRFM